MESAIWDQNLDKAVYVLIFSIAKGMKSSLFRQLWMNTRIEYVF